jgi:hypothetical protein
VRIDDARFGIPAAGFPIQRSQTDFGPIGRTGEHRPDYWRGGSPDRRSPFFVLPFNTTVVMPGGDDDDDDADDDRDDDDRPAVHDRAASRMTSS